MRLSRIALAENSTVRPSRTPSAPREARRPAIDAAPADIKASNDHRKVDERRRSMSWTHPCLPCSLSSPGCARVEGLLQRLSAALRADPARSSTGLASGERGLGQQQQVGDFLRCAAPIFYPYAGQTPIDDDEEARNTLQPSMHRSISCCASPHCRDAQRGALPAPHRQEDRDEKIGTGTIPDTHSSSQLF